MNIVGIYLGHCEMNDTHKRLYNCNDCNTKRLCLGLSQKDDTAMVDATPPTQKKKKKSNNALSLRFNTGMSFISEIIHLISTMFQTDRNI